MFGSFLNIGKKSSVRSNIANNYGGLVSGHHEVNDKNEKKKKGLLDRTDLFNYLSKWSSNMLRL